MPRTHKTKKTLYMDRAFGSEDRFLKAICRAAEAEGADRMQISPHEGRILQFLTRLSQAKKAVEIGTLYGYSALHIARALPEGGQLWTLDSSAKRHKKAQDILKGEPAGQKIRWLCGPALESLKKLEAEGPFDLLFIDADKEPYLEYLAWAERNLRPGALLLADNTFLFGAVYGEPEREIPEKTAEILREFNRRLSNSPCWQGALIPTDEGLTASLKS